jgi:putative ABC transport system substrate-binding protein
MKRRRFLTASVLSAIAPATLAQPRKSLRIGMLGPTALQRSVYVGALVQSLADLGYRDGAGMTLEYRASDGIAERYPKQARELIELKCDLIYALGPEAPARALQDARSPVPIVFLAVDYDPLEKGIVASLRQPDRNTTGIYVPQAALVVKRMEILREVLPRARSFLVLADVFSKDQLRPVRVVADAAGIRLTIVEFTDYPYDLESAFEAGRKAKVDGMIGLASPVFPQRRDEIVALLAKHRLPAIGSNPLQVEAGYLLTLGPHVGKTTRRAAEIGVRILKGAKPSEIPVEQADEFELTVNAKTARALELKIPESVLARATRIVQ